MEINVDKDLTIKSITAIPRSKTFYNFYINGTTEKRSMKLDKLANFITEHCPLVGGTARIMIYEFRPFYVEIETNTIIELVEVPKEPESHKELLFGTRKTILRRVKDTDETSVMDKHKNRIFNNILKLVK